mmetsp:Transcript_5663/g.10829  ORF Transcript_5663/g.10829 Transcript_5663/m.10829 type:complete len:93 (+) Transcript_5663:838-1116(+)
MRSMALSGSRRLEHLGGVESALAVSGTDKQMNLIHEKNNLSSRLLHPSSVSSQSDSWLHSTDDQAETAGDEVDSPECSFWCCSPAKLWPRLR